MLSSPIRRSAAASSGPSPSASRSLSAPSSAASARSRQRSSLNTGTPISRDTSSTGSPTIRRSTTARLRATLQRWPGASGPAAGAPLAGGRHSVDRGRSADGLALILERRH